MNASACLTSAIALLFAPAAIAQTQPEQFPIAPLPEPTELAQIVTDYAAIVVKVPEAIELDLSAVSGTAVPTTLYLAQPIFYRTGNIAIAADCPIEARLVPSANGVRIVTEAVLVNGQLIPLQATSDIVPPSRIETPPPVVPTNAPPQLVSLGRSVGSFLGDGRESSLIQGAMVGQAADILIDLISPPSNPSRAIVTFSPNSQYILRLDAAE